MRRGGEVKDRLVGTSGGGWVMKGCGDRGEGGVEGMVVHRLVKAPCGYGCVVWRWGLRVFGPGLRGWLVGLVGLGEVGGQAGGVTSGVEGGRVG